MPDEGRPYTGVHPVLVAKQERNKGSGFLDLILGYKGRDGQ